MKTSADQGGCYSQRPKVDNTLRDLRNSSYPTKAEFNNCFIIHSKYFLLPKGVSPLRSLFFRSPNITQPCPQAFSVNGSIIFDVIGSIWWRFWRHRFNNFRKAPLLTSLIQYCDGSFQIWWTAAGYGELCVWFKPIRNVKIFWMNNKWASHLCSCRISSYTGCSNTRTVSTRGWRETLRGSDWLENTSTRMTRA